MTLEFTGERFVPGTPGTIAYEHMHRYAFARDMATGKRVLDAACGEGYGAAHLAQVARSVCGIDVDAATVAHASAAYRDVGELRFVRASVAALPLAAASVDVVVSFETIEHIAAPDQWRMVAEFARVLADDGLLLMSSPNRRRYSDDRGYRNPFHVHELYRDELQALLDAHFSAIQWFHQVPLMASAVWGEDGWCTSEGDKIDHALTAEAWVGDNAHVAPAPVPDGLYYVVVAAKHEAALSRRLPRLSLFNDREQSELARAEAAHSEVMRLDGLLRERDTSLAKQHDHIQHLESLATYRERIVEERDAQLAAVNGTLAQQQGEILALRASADATQVRVDALLASLTQAEARLAEAQAEMRRIDAAIAAQERLITYRQSFRWWMQLPWVRAHSWWRRVVGS